MTEVPGLDHAEYPGLDAGSIRVDDGRFVTHDEDTPDDESYNNVLAMAVPLIDFNAKLQAMLNEARNIGWGDSDDEVAGNISPLYAAVDAALEKVVLGKEEVSVSIGRLVERLKDDAFIKALASDKTTPEQIVAFVEMGKFPNEEQSSWINNAETRLSAYARG